MPGIVRSMEQADRSRTRCPLITDPWVARREQDRERQGCRDRAPMDGFTAYPAPFWQPKDLATEWLTRVLDRSTRPMTLTILGLLLSSGAFAQDDSVVVMTSYPDNVIARFEAAFEEKHPEIDMQVLWRSSGDAMAWLAQPGHAPVDVYWTPSPRRFEQLKESGELRQLSDSQRALPDHIGATVISDPDGYFVASETAGYGFAVNRAGLTEAGIPVPADWSDLGQAEYAGTVGIPVPSAVGYAPVLVDIVIQAYGWERGWQVWSEIAGNAQLIRRGATLVSDEVVSARTTVGLSIDFFVASAIANGADIDFVYPLHGGMNPAHVAILEEGVNPGAANAFVDFVLSVEGQTLLGHPDIRKLPVRPDVYANLAADYHNPFAAAEQGAYDYDHALGQPRLPLLTALFEQMLVTEHESHVRLWQAVHAAERSGADMSAARELLGTPLISEQEAMLNTVQAPFRQGADEMGNGGSANPAAIAYQNDWHAQILDRHARVEPLVKDWLP